MPVSRQAKRQLADLIIAEAMERFQQPFDVITSERRFPDLLKFRGWMAKVMESCGVAKSSCGYVFDNMDFKTALNSIKRGEQAFPDENWDHYAKKLEGIYRANYKGAWPFAEGDAVQS